MHENAARTVRGSVLLAVGAATCIALAGCAGARATHSAGSQSAPVAAATLTLPGNVYSIASDPDRGAIWYAVMAAGPATLYEADATTGMVKHSFQLPDDVGDSGLSDDVRVGPDGSIWVTQQYALIKVDPSTGDISTVPLAPDLDGESSAANSTTNPGTWTTSMTVTANSVIVARNNVPFLQEWSFDLAPMAPITLPGGEAGPSDMLPSGSNLDLVYAVHDGEGNANFHDTVTMPRGSSAPVSADGARLGARYLTYRGIGSEARLESAAGVAVVARNTTAGTVDWQTTDAGLDPIKWPREHVQVTSPVGATMNTTVQPTLESATVIADGSLWLVRSGGSVIELINYTS